MNLFINAVSKKGVIILFNEKRSIVFRKNINVLMNESSKLLEEVDLFLKNNRIEYSSLENIVVINGPGSFTGLRTITLIVNTINFIIKKNLTSISFFELFNNYPIVKSSSRRDCFFKKTKDSKIEIILNDDFDKYVKNKNINTVYGDLTNNFLTSCLLNEKIDYNEIIKNIKFDNKQRIQPLYIKKPSIS